MKLIWLDLETTGLNPETDVILEVAAFEAELTKPFDAHKIYDTVLEFPAAKANSLTPFILGMHTDLLKACAVSRVTVKNAELDLMRRLPEREYTLAGSSVHFDHGFIRKHMPTLNKRLSHRHYDVSAVKLFAQSLGMPKFPKAEAHRAAADVMESIAHAKTCAEWFRGCPGPEAS